MICPKCKYEQIYSDISESWKCQHCGVAMDKYIKLMEENEQNLQNFRTRAIKTKDADKKLTFAIFLLLLAAVFGLIASDWGKYGAAITWFLGSAWALYYALLMKSLGYFSAIPFSNAVRKEDHPIEFKMQIILVLIGSALAFIMGLRCLVP